MFKELQFLISSSVYDYKTLTLFCKRRQEELLHRDLWTAMKTSSSECWKSEFWLLLNLSSSKLIAWMNSKKEAMPALAVKTSLFKVEERCLVA